MVPSIDGIYELRVNGAGNDNVNSIANINSKFTSKMETLAGYGTNLPDMVSPSDPIVQSVDINTKLTSYVRAAGASAKDQPKVNSNFRPLVAHPVFDGVNISISRKVVEKVNSDSDFVEVVTIGVPLLTGNDFTKETIRVEYEWKPPRCDLCKIFGHVHDQCLKKVASPPIVTTSNVVTLIIEKTNDGATNEGNSSKSSVTLKTMGTSSKIDNIITSNSYSALNVEEEDVKNVYDESVNLFQNSKTSGSSSFTVAVG
nr:zinc knuckle CX2CX4HX4C [Tanacetum cinerariifolium]